MKQIQTNESLFNTILTLGFLKVSYLASLFEALVFSISITTLPIGGVTSGRGELWTSTIWVYTKLKK